ncbi:uncharacterized protein NPIL_72462 [Nephila pilipes]|uniref:Uncharacterized protein n=1 Tax=Nephila pilipes TaxID=299642 RepID=A0A8X6U0D4_NEPPI|nr:uncharacterized protein NPIL_72462 [Nephila pilipes]
MPLHAYPGTWLKKAANVTASGRVPELLAILREVIRTMYRFQLEGRNMRNSIRKSSGYHCQPCKPPTSIKPLVKYCDSEKLVSRWIGRPASEPCTFQLSQDSRGRRIQEEGRWYPSRYRTNSSSYPQEQSLDCSDDEHEFESMRIPTQEDEEEGPEVSETECDRELKTISKSRGNNSLRVAMPPECHQAALTALTVH